MWWALALLAQVAVIVSGICQERRAGLWSWSKFIFALSFGAMEFLILMVPIKYIDLHSRYFVPALSAAGILAALNFVWMIVVARRWRLPDGRTSIEAYRDRQRILREQQPKR